MLDKVLIIGGLGRIGLVIAAHLGHYCEVGVYDEDEKRVKKFEEEKLPVFHEPHLNNSLRDSNVKFVTLSKIKEYKYVIVTIGTPINEAQNPVFTNLFNLTKHLSKIMVSEQILILSSTVYPGMTEKIRNLFINQLKTTIVAFCPERMATGQMVMEFKTGYQIVAADYPDEIDIVAKLYQNADIVCLSLSSTKAGEYAKLFTNAYRYIQFAAANQMFMMAEEAGCDFYEIRKIMMYKYPRMRKFPEAGFTGGYCLPKDTLQLVSTGLNKFSIGKEAWNINQYLPLFVFRKVRDVFKSGLKGKNVLILGRSFKEETDDDRGSLQIRLAEIFENECSLLKVFDHYHDNSHLCLESYVNAADIVIMATPHELFLKNKDLFKNKHFIDIFNINNTNKIGW